MFGLMQSNALLTSLLIEHAALNHGPTEIVSRGADDRIARSNWRELANRSRQVANALMTLGARAGDRVATVAWNRTPHLELYFGVTGAGVILHTVNPRLSADHISFVINHGGSRHVFVDPDLLPLLEPLADQLPEVRTFIVLAPRERMPRNRMRKEVLCYEDIVSGEPTSYDWPALDETAASTLCYTSGTTGRPKGVLYSHRSTLLHALSMNTTDSMALSAQDSILLVTPLFHANAWGVPFGAAACGAKVVLPGNRMDGKSLYELLRDERCTFSLGVPTVWFGLLDYVESHVDSSERQSLSLERVICGGTAAPAALFERFERLLGVELIHAWGMTETSPLATVCRPLAKHASLSREQRLKLSTKQGRVVFPIEIRIESESGEVLPRDGLAVGHLKVRGPWIASGYYNEADGTVLSDDGWFPTGDVAQIDADGYVQITDRSKDVIKSGGEWISSIEIENAAVGHPAVAEAAAVGVAHVKWQERPLLLVRLNAGHEFDREALLAHLAKSIARWSLPDDIVVVDSLPHTATGKLLKTELRRQYHDHYTDR